MHLIARDDVQPFVGDEESIICELASLGSEKDEAFGRKSLQALADGRAAQLQVLH